ncbi:MAG: protein kinase [Alphaproteobacteria bacterium]|nr:protein kinase [Alphaproteobacteria bacterium]
MDRGTIGPWRITGTLGKGGQGRVVAAERIGPGAPRNVAVKLLEGGRSGLFREARLTSLLRHPHLVDVYEIGEVDGVAYCAMERCDRSLARARLPPRAVVEVGLQVCEALDYAHDAMELVHLDLKPANLLVKDGVVKVADLGIASARGFVREWIGGTPRFMAPEQRGRGAMDARADVFGLGQVLAELATGGDATDAETVPYGSEPAPSGGPPAWLAPIWARCTQTDPDDRYPSMAALADALRALEVEGPGLAEALGVTPREKAVRTAPLFGRSAMLRALVARLRAVEAVPVTLKGPAGIGKSRVAQALCESWGGPAAWVEPGSAEGLLRSVAEAVGVRLDPGLDAVRQLGEALASRGEMLLVLDAVEGLELSPVHAWLARAPGLRVVLTSRADPGFGGWVEEVGPLDRAGAIALIRDRAAERGVHDLDPVAVAELAERLDGVPMALELAAGRLGVLTVRDVLDRLGLSLLRSGELGLTERQATVRGALDWSWELLEPAERDVLAQISVFRGGFTAGAARHVTEDPEVEARLDALGRHSFVRRTGDRYALLATVRQYAAMRLAQTDAPRAPALRHAAFYARLGLGERTPWKRDRAERELANLEAAVGVALAARDGRTASGAAVAAAGVYGERGPVHDGIRLLGRVLDAPDVDRGALLVERARLHHRAAALAEAAADLDAAAALGRDAPGLRGDLAFEREAYEEAEAAYVEALARAEATGRGLGRACLRLGHLRSHLHRREEAEPLAVRALAAFRAEGDRAGEAAALGRLGVLARRRGDPGLARARFAEAVAIEEARGHRLGLADQLTSLGVLLANEGDLEGAYAVFERAVAAVRAGGFRSREAMQLSYLAEMGLYLGRLADAWRHAEAGLAMFEEAGNPRLATFMGALLGRVAWASGDVQRARELLERASAEGDRFAPLSLSQIALADGDVEGAQRGVELALERQSPGSDAHWLALGVQAEVRAAGGETGLEAVLAASVEALEPVSPAFAAEVLCMAARAFRDPARLAHAERLAEGRAPPGSPLERALSHTRDVLA